MSQPTNPTKPGTLADLFERFTRKVPEYFDLLTAETEEDFDRAFTPFLERAITGLEQNSKNFELLDETALTAALTLALRSPGIVVLQETHSNGHVDLTIEVPHCVPARSILAEAKIYRGPSYHIEGLQQLLRRYITGRERRGLVIVYFKISGIATAVQKVRLEMDTRLPLDQQGPTQPHTLKWSFLSVHKHSSGEYLEIGHIGCNLYVDPLLK
jgi:hypothetical protein